MSEASLALYVLMFVIKAYFILLTSFHRTAETALNVNPVCERTNKAMYNFFIALDLACTVIFSLQFS